MDVKPYSRWKKAEQQQSLPSKAEELYHSSSGGNSLDDTSASNLDNSGELWIAGRQASRGGWVRVSDGAERVVYHSMLDSARITLDRPPNFGHDNPTWADGTSMFMYRGTCSRCKDVIHRRSEAGPVALSADGGQVALSFLLCRPCLNWLIESARLEREGGSTLGLSPPISPVTPKEHTMGRGPGVDGGGVCGSGRRDGSAGGTTSRLLVKVADSLIVAAAVVAGEERRRVARATQMKLRSISQHGFHGVGDYLCWFSPEGRVDYFGETAGGRAQGWGLAEYQDGSWCLSEFFHGLQHTPKGGRLSTLQYANGIRYHGEMKDGKPHGKGTKTWPDKSKYTGEFYLGKEHGNGIKTFPDGSEHTGRFRVGVRAGTGTFIDARGRKTAGIFRDDVFGRDEKDGIVAPAETDITIESGEHNPETLLDLVVANLAVLADTQPTLNKASRLMAKMPLHLHPLVAAAFASRAQGLSPGFRDNLPSLAWQRVPEIRLCNAALLPMDITKMSYFLEAIPNLKKLALIGCKLSGDTVGPVAGVMATSQELKEVDLSWNPIRRDGVRAVIAALETAPRLRRLSLAGCRLGGDGGQDIISTIGAGRQSFRLLDLDISYNSLGASSGEALATALRRNETLTRLSLR